jgi:hypothetical protein
MFLIISNAQYWNEQVFNHHLSRKLWIIHEQKVRQLKQKV